MRKFLFVIAAAGLLLSPRPIAAGDDDSELRDR